MIPNETLQTLATTGDAVRHIGNYRITDSTQARILVSLSDKMYTRKELAVVREYSNNAADAHIVAGKPISEVMVTLPIMTDLNFRVRDFGSGLTEDQIRDVYCILGESTKRNSQEQNGVLGYGCKAGFAHSDSFTVTSWVNGEKSIYNCIKGDSTRLHSTILLNRQPSDEPTGIEICVPVKQDSLWVFHREASDFFKCWEVLPTIKNLESSYQSRITKFRDIAPTLSGDGWSIRTKCDGSAVAIAFMGGVSYRIDWNVLYTRMSLDSKKRVLFDLLRNNDVILYYKMGEVNFVDSRESLEYTDFTLKALTDKIEGIFVKIKEAIQAKFDVATNLWEAKLIYNAIFGTGVLEVEKGENADSVDKIKILDGNLMAIENTFRDAFTWKGCPLNSDDFQQINRFDNAFPDKIQDKDWVPSNPVMVTYRRKRGRAKVNPCKYDVNNKIVASNQVVVVVNDTGNKSVQSLASRYFMFGKTDSKISTVHILSFADQSLRDAFYTEYNFDTVPVTKMSDILPQAKTWYNANKASRSYGGGGSGVRVMRYLDVTNRTIEEMDVPIREMEGNNYFVNVGEVGYGSGKKVRLCNGRNESPCEVTSHLHIISEQLGLNLEKVYIINNQTSKAKWFQEAVESGDWINIWDFIKESLEAVNVQELLDTEYCMENDEHIICGVAAKKLLTKVLNKNSPILEFINACKSITYSANVDLVNSIKNLCLWDAWTSGKSSNLKLITLSTKVYAQYPLLEHERNTLKYETYLTASAINKIVMYINAIDFYNENNVEFESKVKVEVKQCA